MKKLLCVLALSLSLNCFASLTYEDLLKACKWDEFSHDEQLCIVNAAELAYSNPNNNYERGVFVFALAIKINSIKESKK